MVAPYDIDQANETFLSTEMKLRKRGGWSKQYSAALAGNEGYNKDSLERQHRLVDQISIGSSPAPTALGLPKAELIYGHRTFFYNVASGASPVTVTIDQSIDFRDRFITGICLWRLNGGNAYLPGGSSDAAIMSPAGDMTANVFGFYTEKGTSVAFIGGSTDHSLKVNSSTGYLEIFIYDMTNSYAVNVNLDYSPKLGRMNIT